ncbi:MAG TPA: hypothetical protein EYP41_03515 [Anaerolineae bacterium]|nr:hypothetical protein [Anaerolineae bacterium]HIP70608.1 hypothetical protein [Anaerolineae bacterium]
MVDREGRQTAVQMDLTAWNALQQLLEDLEDMADIVQAHQEDDETVPWEDVVAEYETTHGLTADVQN